MLSITSGVCLNDDFMMLFVSRKSLESTMHEMLCRSSTFLLELVEAPVGSETDRL